MRTDERDLQTGTLTTGRLTVAEVVPLDGQDAVKRRADEPALKVRHRGRSP